MYPSITLKLFVQLRFVNRHFCCLGDGSTASKVRQTNNMCHHHAIRRSRLDRQARGNRGKHELFNALTDPYRSPTSTLPTKTYAMDTYGLGPNGGMLYCMEYLDANFHWLEELGLTHMCCLTSPAKSS
ncbi:hypothetical protein F5887DRAFT_650264 [Amanita rubescens]|nr:hypothetical protein F5887DRAFT_650264 [Amanita rubescens]